MPLLNQGFTYRKLLGGEAADMRVIEYLALYYPAFSRNEWLARIGAGRVSVDGSAAGAQQILKPGQVLAWNRPPWTEPEVPLSYAILYRDAALLAVAKPSGLPTIPGGGRFMENTLLALVRRRYPAANPLHRLGRGTSGIVLFALTEKATAEMFREWNSRKVLKIYRALVSGRPAEDEFTVDVPIGPVPHGLLGTVHAANADGKPAHTRITVLERRGDIALVQAQITTGRPHQIRIHMAAAGYPLCGDPLYVPGGVPAAGTRALPSDLGYSLHNARIGFHHPGSGEWTEIGCFPPPPLRLKTGT